MVTVIIPAINDPYLQRTVDGIRKEASEIIVINDGGEPLSLPDCTVINHGNTLGRRVSINEAARAAKGDYLFILDAHCNMTDGWAAKMVEACPEKGIVVSAIHDMWPDTWKYRAGIYQHVYMNKRYEEKWWSKKPKEAVEEMMCFTGCSWLIPKKYYWDCNGYDESLGCYGWDGPEWACKVWMGPNPGRVLLRSDVICGHVFYTNNNNKIYPSKQISYAQYRKYMGERYDDRLKAFREKFGPLPEDKSRPRTTVVHKTDIIETKQGDEVIKIVKRHYKPYKVKHDGKRSDKEIESLVLDVIRDVDHDEVILE